MFYLFIPLQLWWSHFYICMNSRSNIFSQWSHGVSEDQIYRILSAQSVLKYKLFNQSSYGWLHNVLFLTWVTQTKFQSIATWRIKLWLDFQWTNFYVMIMCFPICRCFNVFDLILLFYLSAIKIYRLRNNIECRW